MENRNILVDMFTNMVVKKNADLIPKYYHPEFILYSNGDKMDYATFLSTHQKIYATPIQYTIRYDVSTYVEQSDKIAARVFITTTMPNEKANEIEVILIAEYKDNKIYRLWELTYPDWSKMEDFKPVTMGKQHYFKSVI